VNPSTSAFGSGVPEASASSVCVLAIVESAAIPSAPPICCEVLISPRRAGLGGLHAGQRGDRDRHEREADAEADQQEARQQVAQVAAADRHLREVDEPAVSAVIPSRARA
jgi:hypothetical protein